LFGPKRPLKKKKKWGDPFKHEPPTLKKKWGGGFTPERLGHEPKLNQKKERGKTGFAQWSKRRTHMGLQPKKQKPKETSKGSDKKKGQKEKTPPK